MVGRLPSGNRGEASTTGTLETEFRRGRLGVTRCAVVSGAGRWQPDKHGPVLVSTAIEICDWRDPVATSGIRGTKLNAESDILAEASDLDAEYEALVASSAVLV